MENHVKRKDCILGTYIYVASFLPISNSISSLQFSLFDSDTVRKSVNKVIFEIKNIQSSK